MSTVLRLSAAQRQSVECPVCVVRRGQPCQGSRIPGANTFGGGWGGPSSLKREHPARVATVRARLAKRGAGVAS
jgi:hypothetical protein